MFGGVRLGRVAGVPLVVHWTAAVMFGVIVLGLAGAVLPDRVDGYSTAAYWVAGVGGGLLFLASLLVHELAHALVARRHGVPVRQMGLWLLGGAAELEADAPTPRAELRIAAAGPLASLGWAAGLALVAVAGGAIGLLPTLAVTVLAWLAAVNLVLAVFNLIPGAPLDGGRILQAVLWARHGDRQRATLTAARAGRVVGWGAIGFGAAELVVGGRVGGLWTIFLGLFLLDAARGEAVRATTIRALAGLRVGDVMAPDPVTVPSWVSLETFAAHHSHRTRYGAFPVAGLDGRIVGLITLADVKARPRRQWRDLTVAETMRSLEQVAVAAPDDDLAAAADRMRAPGAGGRLLVFEGAALVGVVTPTELAWAMEYGALGATLDDAPAHPQAAPVEPAPAEAGAADLVLDEPVPGRPALDPAGAQSEPAEPVGAGAGRS